LTVLTVGPSSAFATIAAAMVAANPGDTLQLEAGYGDETAMVTKVNLIIAGEESSTGIVLRLATGVSTVTLTGGSPMSVFDATDGNTIVGNAGNNVVTVTDGADAVDGGLGVDRLVVDYRLGDRSDHGRQHVRRLRGRRIA
jgi:Ca2+-binding RTX toxin-like protein